MSAFRSLPVRGAWIEMVREEKIVPLTSESLPVRGAWIEIYWVEHYRLVYDGRSL